MNTSYYRKSNVAPKETTPSLVLIEGGATNIIKLNKDGTVKKTKCNKQAGKSSEVFAFRTEEEIKSVYNVLDRRIESATNAEDKQIAYRNKLLFALGIHLGIRASDLRTLKWSFFFDTDGEFRESYTIQPKKQRKYHKFVTLFFNDTIKKAVKNYLSVYPYKDINAFIFKSREGTGAITEATIWNIIDKVAKEAGIKQNIGSHSLRKTFGYWIWHNAEDKSKALVILMRIFGHSDTATTAKYIGITTDEISETFDSIALDFGCI